jgi:hypothetical protein
MKPTGSTQLPRAHSWTTRVAVSVAILLVGAVAAWSLMPHAPARQAVPDGGRAQLLAVCEAVKPRGGSCGAPAREAAEPAEPMSKPPALGGGNDPARLRPVDVWGNAVQISIDNGGISLRSAGEDGTLGNGDDVVQRCPG